MAWEPNIPPACNTTDKIYFTGWNKHACMSPCTSQYILLPVSKKKRMQLCTSQSKWSPNL
jgi:hypothetical protein